MVFSLSKTLWVMLICCLLSACGGGGGKNHAQQPAVQSQPTENTPETPVSTGEDKDNAQSSTQDEVNAEENKKPDIINGMTVENVLATATNTNTNTNTNDAIPIIDAQYRGTAIVQLSDKDKLELYLDADTMKSGPYNITLKDDTITVETKPIKSGAPNDYREIVSKRLNILRDQKGVPLGFYGVLESIEYNDGLPDRAIRDYITAMKTDERRLPTIAGNYTGKVLYKRDGYAAPEITEADINLKYADRKITGEISHKNDSHFDMRIDESRPHNVDSYGAFEAALIHTNAPPLPSFAEGRINGQFYGKDGEIVTGEITSKDSRWGGVFGAERQQ
ncbi:transferrin-binding protein-like solute binding protein [Salmonella enterica]|uniref:transferrin-binding protein-like solute binding protein n=1 Tax=Salmonella enterica TaxID=28901 RepID=UPI003EDBDB47